MMKRFKNKLCSHTGETIGETLVALLISALALLMLAGAISSASKIVTRNKATMDKYYQATAEGTNQKAMQDKWQANTAIIGLK